MDQKEFEQELYKKAMAAYGDEAAAKTLVDTFMDKVASFGGIGNYLGRADVQKGLAEGVGKGIAALGLGLVGTGIASAVLSGSKAASNVNLRSSFERSLATVSANHRMIRTADASKVKSYAETIFNFAPHVAADPNLLATVLANVIQGEGIDPMTIKTLTELESRYNDNKKPVNLPRIG